MDAKRSWRAAVAAALLAACGGGGDDPIDAAVDTPIDVPIDVPIDAPSGPGIDDTEPPECPSDAPLVAYRGNRRLVMTAFAVTPLSRSVDLDGDGLVDNKLAGLAALVRGPIDDRLAAGRLTVPIEVFDRGADPDACVMLAVYRGVCATASCSYTDSTLDTVAIAVEDLGPSGTAPWRFRSMSTDAAGALTTGIGRLHLELPIDSENALPLPVTVLRGAGTLLDDGFDDLVVHGVLRADALGAEPSPIIEQIGAGLGDTMLDVFYANVLGPLVALPQVDGCRAADVDLDGDGLESFCDTDTNPDLHRVTVCVDGDGTRIASTPLAPCSAATIGGVPRFKDGISASFVLSARPALFAGP